MKKTADNLQAVIRISRAGNARYVKKPAGFIELSSGALKQIAKRIVEERDSTRYIVISVFAQHTVLHYRTEDSSFGSHISMATLFKNKRVAEAVRRAIYGRKLRSHLKIVRVIKTKAGVRLIRRSDLLRK